MRKRRILSLLLAVAVMATMIIAVPLTANAADYTYDVPSKDTTINAGAKLIENNDIEVICMYNAKTVVKNSNYSLDDFNGGALTIRIKNDIVTNVKDESIIEPYSTNQSPIKIVAKSDGVLTAYVGVSKGSRTIKFWDNYDNDDYGKLHTATGSETTISEFEIKSGHTYYMYTRGFSGDLMRLEYTKASSDPSLTLDPTELKIAPGKTGTINANLANVGPDTNIVWTSDKSDSGITVEGTNESATVSVGGEVAIGDTATITATAGQLVKTCEVTVVKPAKDIFIKAGNGVRSVTIKNKDEQEPYEQTITWQRNGSLAASRSHDDVDASGKRDTCAKLADVPFGTYTVTTVVEDKYYNSVEDQEITIEDGDEYASTSSPLKITPERSNGASGPISYDKMYGKTVKWDFSTTTGEANEYLSIESVKNNMDIGVYSDTEGVYMNVDVYSKSNSKPQKGKFDSANSEGGAQTRYGSTLFKIPVVPGSVITVSNFKGSNVMATDEKELTPDSTNLKFTYTGADEKTVTIFVKDDSTKGDNYISKIEVTSPDPADYFGNGTFDSGWYGEDSAKQGVIRFLQQFVGQDKGTVTNYGFYFINSKGEIDAAKISETGELTNDGIYADLYGIESGKTDTYSAKAFVTIGDKTYWSKKIDGSVSDWSDENKIDNYVR